MPINIRSINGVSVANDGTATIGGGATYAQAAAASAAEAALYDGRKTDTLSQLNALTPALWPENTLVRVIETKSVYRAVSSGEDFTNSEGVKVLLLPDAAGRLFVDGILTADTDAARRAAILRIDNRANSEGLIAALSAERVYQIAESVTLTCPQWQGNGGVIRQADGAQLGHVVRLNPSPSNRAVNIDLLVDVNRENNADIVATSGSLVVGRYYVIDTFEAGDDFLNVDCAKNVAPNGFFASGTTPTDWTNGSSLRSPTAAFRINNINSALAQVKLTVIEGDLGVLVHGESEQIKLSIHHRNSVPMDGFRRGITLAVHGSTAQGTPDELDVDIAAQNVGGLFWETGDAKTTGLLNLDRVEQTGDDGTIILTNHARWEISGLVRGMRGTAIKVYERNGGSINDNQIKFDLRILCAVSELDGSNSAIIGDIESANLSGIIRVFVGHARGLKIGTANVGYDLSYISNANATEYGFQLGDLAAGRAFGRRNVPKVAAFGAGSAPGVLLDNVSRCSVNVETNRLILKGSATRDNRIDVVAAGALVVALDGADQNRNTIRSIVRDRSEIAAFNGGSFIRGMRLDFGTTLRGGGASYLRSAPNSGTEAWIDDYNQVLASGDAYLPARGTATIASGTSSIVVTHNLGFTPDQRQIETRPLGLLDTATHVSVTARNSTTFTISSNVNVGADADIFWRVIGLGL
jgi:hypothetical protein